MYIYTAFYGSQPLVAAKSRLLWVYIYVYVYTYICIYVFMYIDKAFYMF